MKYRNWQVNKNRKQKIKRFTVTMEKHFYQIHQITERSLRQSTNKTNKAAEAFILLILKYTTRVIK